MPTINTSNPLDTVSERTFDRRHYFFDAVLALSIIGFAFFTVIAYFYDYLSLDVIITKYLQETSSPILDTYLNFITELGNYPTILVLIGLTLLFLVILKRFKDAIFILISTAGITLISEILKDLISRPRPTIPIIENTLPNLPPGSFPSGHVLFYCGFFGAILFLVYTRLKKSLWRDIMIGGLFLLIFSVGISRIYLGAHWMSDVIGSYCLGFIWLYLMSFVYKNLLIRNK